MVIREGGEGGGQRGTCRGGWWSEREGRVMVREVHVGEGGDQRGRGGWWSERYM